MTADQILVTITRHGGRLTISGDGKLRYCLPKDIATPALKELLREHKVELLRLLDTPSSSTAIPSVAGNPGAPNDDSLLQKGPEWLVEAVEVALQRAHGCFLCRWLVESINGGELRVTGRSNGQGGDLFPVQSQIEHLRLEYSIYRSLGKGI